MKPVLIEVVMPLPESYGMCAACEALFTDALPDQRPLERGLEEYPPDWQADFRQLMDWVADLTAQHRGRVSIQLTDPRSPRGLWKALRHRARRYPTFIVSGANGHTRVVGWDREGLDAAVQMALAQGRA
jgi:hypothetical protein